MKSSENPLQTICSMEDSLFKIAEHLLAERSHIFSGVGGDQLRANRWASVLRRNTKPAPSVVWVCEWMGEHKNVTPYQFWSDRYLAWQSLHQCTSVCEVLWVIGWIEVQWPFLLPTIPANCISRVQDQETIIPTQTKAKWLHTSDRRTVFRKVLQFPSWQLFKPPNKCREGEKKNVEQRWIPHTYIHTLFNTFRKPLMNDILWGTVSVRPTHPLQILIASIHKCTWTVKGRWKLSLLWGIKKKPVAYLPAGTMPSPIWHPRRQGSCPEWETTWPFTKAC